MPSGKSIRLIYPQWQGGNNEPYYFGAEMLGWLADQSIGKQRVFRVPVHAPSAVPPLRNEGGVMGRCEVLHNLRGALDILEREEPDRVVVLGGDCGVSLGPFAYLSARYAEEVFGVLWIDSHPDVTTRQRGFPNSHMHVLANLMGHGDGDLTRAVRRPVPASRVLLVGVHSALPHEVEFIEEHKLTVLPPETAKREGPRLIAEWLKRERITRLAIHFDIDVLNPQTFTSTIFSKPNAPQGYMDGVARGTLELREVGAIVRAAGSATDVVGVTFAEYFPWDAMGLKKLLEELPLAGGQKRSKL